MLVTRWRNARSRPLSATRIAIRSVRQAESYRLLAGIICVRVNLHWNGIYDARFSQSRHRQAFASTHRLLQANCPKDHMHSRQQITGRHSIKRINDVDWGIWVRAKIRAVSVKHDLSGVLGEIEYGWSSYDISSRGLIRMQWGDSSLEEKSLINLDLNKVSSGDYLSVGDVDLGADSNDLKVWIMDRFSQVRASLVAF